jgi:hypothetical protein
MKTMNKVIAAMMMAITFAMPAMAGNKNHNGKKDKVVAVNNKKVSHFDKKVDKKTTHFDAHKLLTSGMRHPKYFLRSNNSLMDCCSSVKNSVLVSFC